MPAAAVPIEPPAATNAAENLRVTQEAIERLRRDVEQSATRNAEAMASALSVIEPALARMHESQMEVRSSNRTILVVAGMFAAVGFVGLVFIALILLKAIGRFSEIAAAPRVRMLGPGDSQAGLGGEVMIPPRAGAAEQASARFHGAIEQLQRRIGELEQGLLASASEHVHGLVADAAAPSPAVPSPSEPTASNIQRLPPAPEPGPGRAAPAAGRAPSNLPSRASVLLGKGQALLNLDAADEALQCFDEALTLEPGNPDALVKRGMALEKMQDWEQALDSYTRAIARDSSLTVAYLYRGGVCNRLQRYREALESYEEALRTEKKSRAS